MRPDAVADQDVPRNPLHDRDHSGLRPELQNLSNLLGRQELVRIGGIHSPIRFLQTRAYAPSALQRSHVISVANARRVVRPRNGRF